MNIFEIFIGVSWFRTLRTWKTAKIVPHTPAVSLSWQDVRVSALTARDGHSISCRSVTGFPRYEPLLTRANDLP